ncbi:uncharacterized protein FIBRA_00038 [Fibroporia radiculosa]|uniref:GST N-terminal domain-containing protein n=1 Tax=Fibroporia radiculosa TaxID=599839 RepID=J7S5I9_9APHY|nr:uncharacterized protein FIBRA_00038 [Fibroporia radiculosa]CCL98044.1 predicted protein [Fibroporia radiculosa]
MAASITLYTAKICPYAHRVELALEEAKATYTKYPIDLQNKPSWYAPKVNPASKVPAIAYGGPPSPPEDPSPESEKIAESLVLIEFVNDLFPQAHLLPADPVLRAKARFFIEFSTNKLIAPYSAFQRTGASADDFLAGVVAVQELLPADGFAVGPYSLADVAVTPFIARAFVGLRNEIGAYDEGEGKKVLEALAAPRYARFHKYWADLQARPNFKATFDEPYVTEAFKKRFGGLRAQK